MNQKNKDEVVNYTMGVTGVSTLSALLKSMRQSKLLSTMVVVGIAAVVGFFYFMLS